MKKIAILFTVVFCLSLPANHVLANDEVLNVIGEAVKQYKEGNYAGAASNLDYASQLVRQKKSDKMKELLPEPLDGWQAQAASSQAVGTAIFGGAVTVSREYKKGASMVSVEIISDSPVLQSVVMMMNNPMFAGAGGGKLETIKEQRAIVKYNPDSKEGDINIILSGKFIITLKGKNVSREELMAYARKIDFSGFPNK